MQGEEYMTNAVHENDYLKIPWELFHNEKYKNLNSEAKIIYALLLDYVDKAGLYYQTLSTDEKGDKYLILPQQNIVKAITGIMGTIDITDKTTADAFRQLEETGLIEPLHEINFPNLVRVRYLVDCGKKKWKNNWLEKASMIFNYSFPFSVHTIVIYFFLCSRADSDGQVSESYSTIAKKCKISRNTVIRAINELKIAGLISVEQRKGEDGGVTTNLYRIHT